jgi:RluA family pseudouridine synthase
MTLPDILFEDDALVAFDKPAGLAVVSGGKGARGASLVQLARERLGRQVANVHRLDDEASGIVLCAKTKPALDFLSGQFQSKTVLKAYFALVALAPSAPGAAGRDAAGSLQEEFSVELPLGEDRGRPGLMRVTRGRGGSPSVTQFRVLEPFGRFAWVECRPLTGRTHQLRVHLAACAAPVLNDRLYGDPSVLLLLSELKRRYKGREQERPLVTRLALHAGALGFMHPVTRERLEVRAPLPQDLEIALKYLRRFAAPPARRTARGA